MVARITIPKSISKALNYNEKKVQQGKATCLRAVNFLKEPGQMNFHEKLKRFEGLTSLNQRAKTNCLHVSLNFSPNEKPSDKTLSEIAETYMDKIGFGEQPFLVYRHIDAGHPHIHIISTNIRDDGKRISLHNLGKEKSSIARKEIELQFGLIKAQQKVTNTDLIESIRMQRIHYGNSPTRQQLSNIITAVTRDYVYASLPELNAVLKLYNVTADRGAVDSLVFRKKGLRYATLDANGNKIGVPLKASLLAGKPTLSYLELKFEENKELKQAFKKSIKTRIDWILKKKLPDIETFKKELEKENISLQMRQNDAGRIYGLTYIDLANKVVFNGNDIGKPYAANGLLQTLGKEVNEKANTMSLQLSYQQHNSHSFAMPYILDRTAFGNIINELLESNPDYAGIPFQFKQKDKRKRKK